ncbi:DoxX family protein [Saccharopolyspora taberi]|uniref:DoxX family protein n=1 Tax=Saccharopolyspora taberi TaxID=60895 RepID=A0ABN3VD87_9PSEU
MDIARDLFAFVGRLGIGIIFVAHGLQKLTTMGISGVAQGFETAGIPLPVISAWYNVLVELIGGVLLIIGLALPLVGVLLAINMAGALVFVHLAGGLFLPTGFEYVLALGVAALAIGFNGGRWAVDKLIFGRRAPAGV